MDAARVVCVGDHPLFDRLRRIAQNWCIVCGEEDIGRRDTLAVVTTERGAARAAVDARAAPLWFVVGQGVEGIPISPDDGETVILRGVERVWSHIKQLATQCDELREKNAALLGFNEELEARLGVRTHELASAQARIAEMAVTDGLTGLHNRRHLLERLPLEVQRSMRSGLPISVIVLDIDGFKEFNEKHGYAVGDQLLRDISTVLDEGQRANDFCCRYGGDELAVVLVDTERDVAVKVANRLRQRVTEMARLPDTVTATAIVASYPRDAGDATELIATVEELLRKAEGGGRDRVVLAAEVSAEVRSEPPPKM